MILINIIYNNYIQIESYFCLSEKDAETPDYCVYMYDGVCRRSKEGEEWAIISLVDSTGIITLCESMKVGLTSENVFCSVKGVFTGKYKLILTKYWIEGTPRKVWSDGRPPEKSNRTTKHKVLKTIEITLK